MLGIDIFCAFLTLPSSQQTRIQLVVDEIYVAAGRLLDEQSRLRSQTEQISQLLFCGKSGVTRNTELLDGSSTSPNAGASAAHGHRGCITSNMHPSNSADEALKGAGTSDHPLLGVKVLMQSYQRGFCTSRCNCVCHASRQYRSPRSFDALLGTLFTGYTGSPIRFAGNCTSSHCKSRSLKVQYFFPQWFLHDTIATLTIATSGAPAFCLSVTRFRAGGADILRLVKSHDLRSLQLLYSTGSGSPKDVFYDGQTALHVGRSIVPSPHPLHMHTLLIKQFLYASL